MEKNICRTCKHFRPMLVKLYRLTVPCPPGRGSCERAFYSSQKSGDNSPIPDNSLEMVDSDHVDIPGGLVTGILTVGELFGCIHHEKREEPNE